MNIIKNHLPSYCYSKNKMKSMDGIVVHFISAKNVLPDDPFNRDAIIKILKDYGFSYHYLIERDGTIIELVPGMHKAYHAGKSIMNERESCNDFAVGITLAGGTDFPYTDEQMLNLGTLSAQLMTEHKFTDEWIQGHDKVRANWNNQYPDKKKSVKVDPGNHFQWEILKDMLYSVSLQVEHEQKLG